VQRRRANVEAATEQREHARRTDGSQRPTEVSSENRKDDARQPASQPAGGGGGESTTQPPTGLNLRHFFL